MTMKHEQTSLKLKFSLIFVLFVAGLFTVIIFNSMQQIQKAASVISSTAGMPVLSRALSFIDGDEYERLAGTLDGSDPFYIETQAKFRELREETRCLYLYTMARYGDGMHRFIFDGEDPGSENFSPIGTAEDIGDYGDPILLTYETKTPQFAPMMEQSGWGRLVSAYMPILNGDGDVVGVIGVDFEGEEVYQTIMSNLRSQIISALVFVIAGLFLYLYFFRDIERISLREHTALESARHAEKNLLLGNALVSISKSPDFFSGVLKEAADCLAREACRALNTTRVGVWSLTEDASILKNITSFEASTGAFVIQDDFDLTSRDEYAGRFVSDRLIVINDASRPNPLSDITANYNPGICAMLDAPIRIGGKPAGIVCIEQERCGAYPDKREWTVEEQNFASSLADLMAHAITNIERQAILQNNAALDRVNLLKSDLIATLSHEMRTPLTVMKAFAQYAVKAIQEGDYSNAAIERLGTITIEADRLAKLSENFLMAFKEPGSKRQKAPVSVSGLISHTASVYKPIMDKKNNRQTLDVSAGLPDVYGNEEDLTQVLFNLLSNAQAHTANGEIRIAAKSGGGFVTVTVADTGSGIAPEFLPHVFEKYRHDEKGTGYGLAICKEIIEEHGGEIRVESSPAGGPAADGSLAGGPAAGSPAADGPLAGKGTSVSFSLPVWTEETAR